MVDVIIPVYNGERFILQALNSVAAQTCAPARIIVVDDGSTDGTGDLVKSYRCDLQVDYIRQDNGGLSAARNTGILNSQSVYVAFLDADDEWYPEKLAEQLRVFSESDLRNLGVVYCEYRIIDICGNFSDDHHLVSSDRTLRGSIFESLLPRNMITGSGSGVLVKRECFDRVGMFDEALGASEDWDMWLRLAEQYEFDLVPLELVKIRRHHGNMQNDTMHMFTNQLRFFNKWLSRLPDNSSCITGWRRYCASTIIAGLPGISAFKALNVCISRANRRKLFSVTGGSLLLYLIVASPALIVGMTKYALWERSQGNAGA